MIQQVKDIYLAIFYVYFAIKKLQCSVYKFEYTGLDREQKQVPGALCTTSP